MLKKRIAILLLTLSYAILLGHNIVPHHHHDKNHDLIEHHQTDNHHDDHEDEGLNHLLSHFVHSTEGITFTNTLNISNTFSERINSFIAVLFDNFSLKNLPIPPLLYKPPAEHFIYLLPHSSSFGLRAPPAFIG